MMRLALLALLISSAGADDTCGNEEYQQCGGLEFTGSTCCPSYDDCVFVNSWYSQCQPTDLCLTLQYGQCGGIDFDGQECCPGSFTCTYSNDWYSQCLLTVADSTECAVAYEKCDGKHGDGSAWGTQAGDKECCITGFECIYHNDWYSQCQPIVPCTNPRWGQCGGYDSDDNPWLDDTDNSACCPGGFECEVVNTWYSQCQWA